MEKEKIESLLAKVSILKEQGQGKSLGPIKDSEKAQMKKQLDFLKTIISNVKPHLLGLNWLEGWGDYSFDRSLAKEEIDDMRHTIELLVRGTLSEWDSITGAFHTIYFNWVEHSPYVFTLEAYLNPSAAHVPGPGGGGGGVISPTPPQQPPPPPLG